jgi:hypothetical protein
MAQCPRAGLPVTRVESTAPGGYLIWVRNGAPVSHNTFNIRLEVPVTRLLAVAVNGTAIQSITGSGTLWKVVLAGAGVRPGGFLVLSVTGVTPAVAATCEALVRFVLTSPPIYR